MDWKVFSYYTKNSIYEKYSENLVRSLGSFSIPFDVIGIEDQGNWYKNTQYKATFVRECLDKFDGSVVYVDCDAVFCSFPKLFDSLKKRKFSVAAYVLDHSKFRRKHHRPELLSGTLFFKNSDRTIEIVDDWVFECSKGGDVWDQRALEKVVKKEDLFELPEEYCCIFDYMNSVRNPVIKHFQASRSIKNKESQTGNLIGKVPIRKHKSVPRKVNKNGKIMVRRVR